jgi:hypothetical protein
VTGSPAPEASAAVTRPAGEGESGSN